MVKMEKIPKHIAVIMDGNGRWAEKNRVPKISGHNAGMKAMKEIVKEASTLGVEHLTVYAFSTENWKRSLEEINGIFNLIVVYVEKELRELHKNGVKVKILGDYSKLPKEAVKSLQKALETTKNNEGLQFNIALNYGGRDEILRAVKDLSKEISEGGLATDELTEEVFETFLYTGRKKLGDSCIPDPELLIRTSGEKRLSNYLIWQCAYSEFVFTDVLWPDFTPEIFRECIEEYQNRNRRFGGR